MSLRYESLPLGSCHSPLQLGAGPWVQQSPFGEARGLAVSHKGTSAGAQLLCTLSLCHPLSVPVPLPQGPLSRRHTKLSGQQIRVASPATSRVGRAMQGLWPRGWKTSSGHSPGPLGMFLGGCPCACLHPAPLGASFWKPAAKGALLDGARTGHCWSLCSPETILGASRVGSASPLGPWDGWMAPSVRPHESSSFPAT